MDWDWAKNAPSWRLRAEIRALEVERDEARRKTATEVILALMPVGPLTNRVPSRYLAEVEKYITKQFGVTGDDIKEVFQHDFERRSQREKDRRALERATDLLDRVRCCWGTENNVSCQCCDFPRGGGHDQGCIVGDAEDFLETRNVER